MVDKEVVPYRDGVPQLVSGLIAEGYKHLYIFGITQVRYGAGPLMYDLQPPPPHEIGETRG
jgi:hypothetical protein